MRTELGTSSGSALQLGRSIMEIADDPGRAHAVLGRAEGHYRGRLTGSVRAIRYLAARGVSGATARAFGLGYAMPAWQDLEEVFAGEDDQVVDATGLLVASSKNPNRRFDRFRDRIMFPIRDLQGLVVGFGGRSIEDAEDGAKYINSPETVLFRKHTLLYGLYEARAAIVETGHAIVQEGYFDVVSSVQAGVGNVVGTLGTACTVDQLQTLLELVPSIVFCFDGDRAGRKAAAQVLQKVAALCAPGRSFRFVTLPEGEDPDSFVRKHGGETLRAAVAGARNLVEFALDLAGEGADLDTAEGRALCLHRCGELWRLMPPDTSDRWHLLVSAASAAAMTPEVVVELWNSSSQRSK